jgi:hypothetical protein
MMNSKEKDGSYDLLPGDGLIEKPLPQAHVMGKKIRAEISKKVQREIGKNKKDDDHGHCSDDGPDGVFSQSRKEEG